MAKWQKVVVSGSSAVLAGLSVDATITGDISGDAGGNAASATQLANARTIAGVSFDGTANISLNNNTITNGAGYITSGGSISGNAATATQLETARNIGGVSFDGTADINLPGVNTAGNQNTSGTAAGLSSTLAITSGGTGATSRQAAIDALTDASGASQGQVLSIDGSGNAVFANANAGDITGIDAGTAITVTDPNTATPTVSVSDAGITGTQLNASVAGSGLAGGAGSALSVNVDDVTVEISGDAVQAKTAAIANGGAALATADQIHTFVTTQTDEIAAGTSGNAATATQLETSRNLQVALGTTSAQGFDGSGNATSIGVSGQLAPGNGGTGLTSITTLLNSNTTAGDVGLGNVTNESKATMFASPAFTGTATAQNINISGDTVIAGDLTVQGTASFESTENLLVKDRFIGLASGSGAAADGGIVVEQSNVGGGKGAVFAYDGISTGRWGVDLDFNPTASAYTPAAFMSNVLPAGSQTSAAAIAAINSTYNKNGNIYTSDDSNGNEIWIYA